MRKYIRGEEWDEKFLPKVY